VRSEASVTTIRFKYVLLVVTAACLVTPAAAEESALYGGLALGKLSADFSRFEDTSNIGAILGYDLYRDPNGSLALEAEFTTTLTDGDIRGGGGWDARTVGAYGAYRTAGKVFLKVKAGILDQHIGASGGGPLNANDTGFSYGAGVGARLNSKAALEVEYTGLSDHLGLISLAYVTHF
jgi:Outer membrane protein beta-barrel domain